MQGLPFYHPSMSSVQFRDSLYRRHIQRLSQIHLCHLRAILGVKWSDRVTNNEVQQCAITPSIEAMLLSQHLTWTGHIVQLTWTGHVVQLTWSSHIVRMNDDRPPKAILYGELWQAKRNVGKPHLCYLDCTKRHPHATDINKRGGDGARSQCIAYGHQKRSHKSRNQKSNRCRNETTMPP